MDYSGAIGVIGVLAMATTLGWGLYLAKRSDAKQLLAELGKMEKVQKRISADRAIAKSELNDETQRLAAARTNIRSLNAELDQVQAALTEQTKSHSITKGLLTKARKKIEELEASAAGSAAK